MNSDATSSAVCHLLLLLLLCQSFAEAFYIPGFSIKSYRDSESIPLFVNKVYSDNTQLQYAYYDLPFVCPPTGTRHPGSPFLSGQRVSLNLGEILRGDRIMTSDVELAMGQDQECRFLCTQQVSRKDVKRAQDMVRNGYVAEWIVDNLPAATSFTTVDKSRKYYAAGFKLGYKDFSPTTGKPRYFVNNHLTIVLRYRKAPGKDGERGKKVIVGFEVYTKSVGTSNRLESGCPADPHQIEENMELQMAPNRTKKYENPHLSYHPPEDENEIEDGAMLSIPYSYSVYWREDEKIEWSHRWDLYFVNQEQGSRFHWLAIVNSLIISGLLSAIVAMILARTIHGDIKNFKDGNVEDGKLRFKRRSRPGSDILPRSIEKSVGLLDQPGDEGNDADISSDDESLEDITGWKLLHGDVFRAPAHSTVLAPFVGSGMQLIFMTFGLLLLSSLGILNPSFRGGFVSVGIGLFIFAGVFSGYFSARVYKTFGGLNWRRNTLVTALLFPGLLFGLSFVLNLFVWAQGSSTALPFSSVLGIILLWLFVQLPLVYVGSWHGFVRSAPLEHPTKTTSIPRQIPTQPWFVKPVQSVLLAGLIPFAVIFIELLFVFQSVWQDKSGYYYVFGFLSVVCVILTVTIAEVTVVTVYIQLCSENYNWWWQSFLVGGGSSVWVFVYCVWYYFNKLNIDGFVSSLLFFAYSGMACAVYGLLTGTVGFLTALIFVRRIYSAIKAD